MAGRSKITSAYHSTLKERNQRMKVFGDPSTKAKVRRYIVWGVEDGIVCAAFLAGGCLAGWLFHVIFSFLGVA